jgi:hypothetical protein
MENRSSTLTCFRLFSRTACFYPVIDFGLLEFPEPSNTVGWHVLLRNPRINRVLANTKVLSNFFNGKPAI